ncbi:MAG TPA: class I SAM-dependent methyltransferase [Fibrobacteria bacterium]|nr:class I SAM-dependent methyltransferase [Fibrobacteria bacterium]
MTQATAFNRSYTGLRADILSLVPAKPRRVLDLGCATGEMGRYLADTFGAEVWGVEYDGAMAQVARPKLRDVWRADLNKDSLSAFPHGEAYDLIVCGDVLEHLVDPWRVLRDAAGLLRSGGHIVASLPNIGHFTTLMHLALLREWPYRDRGIHDRTHLRFFTRRNLIQLYRQAGLEVEAEKRNLRLWESGSPVDGLARLADFPPFRSFVTFQYIHRLRKP